MKLIKQRTEERYRRQITHRESENEGENLVQKKLRAFEIAGIEIISIRRSTENVNRIET